MFAHTNLITYESLYSSSYLLNEYLLYDKLWGPSQRVVTLLQITLTLARRSFNIDVSGLERGTLGIGLKKIQQIVPRLKKNTTIFPRL